MSPTDKDLPWLMDRILSNMVRRKTVTILIQKGENESIGDLCGCVNESVIGYKPKKQFGKGREKLPDLPIATLI